MKRKTILAPLFIAAVAAFFAFGLFETSRAAPKNDIPFPNPAQQRLDTVAELKQIAALLQEQNKILKEQTNLLRDIKRQSNR